MNSIRSQIKSMLSVSPRTGGYQAVFALTKELSILPDHFSYAPILPGICIVQAVLLSGAMAVGVDDLRMLSLKNAKLLHPILPGETVLIDADSAPNHNGQIAIRAKITGDGKRRAEISLIAMPVTAAEAVPA
jgi:3-hydroxymyristoyl/3-hydroxydecanoyl-(acyl carrier protein) dehydratase